MLPDWPHDNNGCCFIMSQLAQWRQPRRYTEILNSNLPNGKSMGDRFLFLYHPLPDCFFTAKCVIQQFCFEYINPDGLAHHFLNITSVTHVQCSIHSAEPQQGPVNPAYCKFCPTTPLSTAVGEMLKFCSSIHE